MKSLVRQGRYREALSLVVCLQIDQGREDTYLVQGMERLPGDLVKSLLQNNLREMGIL